MRIALPFLLIYQLNSLCFSVAKNYQALCADKASATAVVQLHDIRQFLSKNEHLSERNEFNEVYLNWQLHL